MPKERSIWVCVRILGETFDEERVEKNYEISNIGGFERLVIRELNRHR